MANFSQFLERAGFQVLFDSKTVVANQVYPVFVDGKVGRTEQQPLLCSSGSNTPPLSFLYFTLPGCENCRAGLLSLHSLAERMSHSMSAAERMCIRVVVSDWPTQFEIEQDLRDLGWSGRVGVVWDAVGALQERLSVVAVPSSFLLDDEGRVFALNAGPVSFGSPGFESLETALRYVIKNIADSNIQGVHLAGRLHQEIPVESSAAVMFLNNNKLSFVWLVAAFALCYSLIRLFLRLRKNFDGS